ncbi:hypothetical protein KP509_21G036600 [Ceratopteris richardii]|uniref:Phototropic-responsive NPH3 family protein n=1 Tax=Ceratopteris richardii TaxID=49495 RepID=A0A8T2SAH1_CERRI|nr:hypothetical protein KP509_21G036600 [Ceratopteris richardii]
MAVSSIKLGSKPNVFLRKGQEWFCSPGLPSDVTIQVQEMSFHLHKFPLVARSRRLARILNEAPTQKDDQGFNVTLHDIPGGADAFELAASFCYGFHFELTSSNVVRALCAAEYLEMYEDLGEGNLKATAEEFLNEVVLHNFRECVLALRSCEAVLPYAEALGIITSCIDAAASMVCIDYSNLEWPMLHSPGGSLLWNGISTGAMPKKACSDWWYEDLTVLPLAFIEKIIRAVEARGMKPQCIAGAVMCFAKKHLSALNNRWQGVCTQSNNMELRSSEGEQKHMLETIESMLPTEKGILPTNFLSALLRSAIILNANPDCKGRLEKRIGLQLEQATLKDLLLPNMSYNSETLYDIDRVQRIFEHFLLLDQSTEGLVSPSSVQDGMMSPPPLTPLMIVARLADEYLAEVAPDVNLKLSKFLSVAEVLPEYSRITDDGLYRAIDIFLKARPWLKEKEREQLCRIMDCQKLSLEACTHAAQNERLPLRVVVQVLFFEQLQLRTAIANCFMMSDTSRALQNQSIVNGLLGAPSSDSMKGLDSFTNLHAGAEHEDQTLKMDMDDMRLRMCELEKECSGMRAELQKLGKMKGHRRLMAVLMGRKFRAQLCRARGMVFQNRTGSGGKKPSPAHSSGFRHRRSSSVS